ncbi:hypothetical protein NMG60_11007788 [Bertholletia excelsa]
MGQCASGQTKQGGERWEERSVAPRRHHRYGVLIRQQRARFYIARRCLVMLICWPKYSKI